MTHNLHDSLSLMGEGWGEGVTPAGVKNSPSARLNINIVRARTLRANMTDAEKKLWKLLRSGDLGDWKFRRQHPIEPYIADFACPEVLLIVEVDGGQHCDNKSDGRRTAYLEQHGWHVLRFWNNEVMRNLDGVAQVLQKYLEDAPLRGKKKFARSKASYRPMAGENTLTRPPLAVDLSHEGEVKDVQ